MMKRVLFLVVFGLAIGGAVAQSHILRSIPYLQNPINNGVTVCWQTNVPAYSYVEWCSDTSQVPQMARTLVAGQALAGNTFNKIRIQGLEPGRTYFYRIVSRHLRVYEAYYKEFGDSYTSPYYPIRLPKADQKDFDILVFNDLHQRVELLDSLMRMVRAKKIPYSVAFFNGDCIDDPADEAQAIGTMDAYNRIVGSTSIPVIYMRGNHEIRNAYSIGLNDLFDYMGGQTYTAFSWGDTRFVLLDCGEDKPDSTAVYYGMNDFSAFRADQLEFLRKEHQGAPFQTAAKRVLMHHIPLWSLAPQEDGANEMCLALWGEELSRQPYSLAINAHTHIPELLKAGAAGNPFPVLKGGGPSFETATVIHLEKRGKTLRATLYTADGTRVWRITC